METSAQREHKGIGQLLSSHRGFVILVTLLSCWSLYIRLQNVAGRFHVPHNFVTSFTEFGRVGIAIDLFFYLWVTWLGLWFVKSADDWVSRAMIVGFIGPLAINPLKMIVPRYAFAVWWVELLMNLLCLLASVAVFQRQSRMNSSSSVVQKSKQSS